MIGQCISLFGQTHDQAHEGEKGAMLAVSSLLKAAAEVNSIKC
jgi:hypothetical protein